MMKLTPLLCIMLLFGCVSQRPQLYSWSHYDNLSYQYFKNQNDKTTSALMEDYQKIIDKQKESRNTPPPGLYGDYGYLLIQSGRMAEGKDMLIKEMALYPESTVFINRILQMFKQDEKK